MLKLHYLRWVLFDIGGDTYFMYQGIFDTDFDKYTEDAVALFGKYGITTIFENLEGFPADWKTNAPAFVEFVREHQRPSFLEYGEYPYVSARRDQEGAAAQAGVRPNARRDAVTSAAVGPVLELDDIQHFLVARTPALAARYEFLTFPNVEQGRAWLAAMLDKVGSAAAVGTATPDARWVTVAFTWNGLRALGRRTRQRWRRSPRSSARAWRRARRCSESPAHNAPEHWVGGLASPDLHAIVILFARDVAERERCRARMRAGRASAG